MFLSSQTVALYLLVSLCSALIWNEAPQTTAIDWPGIAFNSVPIQTASPHELLKRIDGSNSLCGYISDNPSNPLTCAATDYCGFQSTLSLFGCCTAAAGGSLTGCNFQTSCFDSTQASTDCLGQCQSNTRNLLCTQATAPNCMIFSYTDGNIPYEAFGCSTAYETVFFGSTYIASSPAQNSANTGFSVTSNEAAGTPTTNSNTPTIAASTSVGEGGSSVVPISFTQTQPIVGTKGITETLLAPSTSTSDADQFIGRFWVWKMLSIGAGLILIL